MQHGGLPMRPRGRNNDFSNIKDDDDYDKPSKYASPLWGYLLFFIMCGGGLFSLYTVIFPDRPSHLDITDKTNYNDLFFSGKSALVLCANKTINNEKIGTAMNQAVRSISDKATVLTYYINCNKTLANGRTVLTTHNIRGEYPPILFLVGNGRKPYVLPPHVSYNATEIGTSIISSGLLRTKHTRIDNDHDYDTCIRERSGGCLIIYTPNNDIHKNTLLSSLPGEFPLVQLAILRANSLSYKTVHSTLDSLVKQAVRDARNNALASSADDDDDDEDENDDSVSDEDLLFGTKSKPKVKKSSTKNGSTKGTKAMVLIHTKRIISKGDPSYGKSASLLVTVHACSSNSLTKADISIVLENAKQSANLLKESSDQEEDKGHSIEGLLERDEKLLQHNSTMLSRGDISIQRVIPKTTPTPVPSRAQTGTATKKDGSSGSSSSSSSNQPRRVDTGNTRVDEALKKSDQRKADRMKRNQPQDLENENSNPTNLKNGETGDTVIDLDKEENDQIEWERQRRQRMLEEEKESGFVAHAANDKDDEGNTNSDADETPKKGDTEDPHYGQEEEEEVTDLDEMTEEL